MKARIEKKGGIKNKIKIISNTIKAIEEEVNVNEINKIGKTKNIRTK